VDVGDALNSVLWRERGDDDDICDGRSSMGMSTDTVFVRWGHFVFLCKVDVGQTMTRATELGYLGSDSCEPLAPFIASSDG